MQNLNAYVCSLVTSLFLCDFAKNVNELIKVLENNLYCSPVFMQHNIANRRVLSSKTHLEAVFAG